MVFLSDHDFQEKRKHLKTNEAAEEFNEEGIEEDEANALLVQVILIIPNLTEATCFQMF